MRRWQVLPIMAVLAACTVGPNYEAPRASLPPRFAEAPVGDDAQAPALDGWWRAYGDPELDRLIAIALQESPDLGIAVARIEQARAQVRVARAAYLPEVNASAETNYQRFSKNAGLASLSSLFGGGAGGGGGTGGGGTGGSGGIAAPGNDIQTYSVGFDASWEIDLFGGTRRAVEGASARLAAAEWRARDAQLSLIADVADAYLQLRTDQARERIARDEVARQERALQLMADTARTGLVPEGDFIRQRVQLATAQAAVAPIVADGKAQMHALAVLLGRTPDAMIAELAVERPQLAPPPPVPPGLPSDLLRRRPDIRAAERDLAAATADIGVAVADLYPRFSLTGAAQLISTALGNLFSGDSLQLTGNAAAQFPLLDFGRRRGEVATRRAQADESYYTYRTTVLRGLRDVEDALIRLTTDRARSAALANGLKDADRATAAVEARYRVGLVDLSVVLDARSTALSTRDQLAQSDGAQRRDLLALYKALGGGWEGLTLAKPQEGSP